MFFSLVDMKANNLGSLATALTKIGVPFETVSTPEEIARADTLILPGVGAFGEAMTRLREDGLVDPLQRAAGEGRFVLGICLGMQLLVEISTENGLHKGVGLFPGRVDRLSPTDPRFGVPNIGWCDIHAERPGVLFPDETSEGPYYFVHSYHVDQTGADAVAATMTYSGGHIAVALEKENIFGVQFHPEKSQDLGLNLLHRYCTYVRETRFLS